MTGSSSDTLTLGDIQGNILRAYNMPHARYLFLRFSDDAAAARAWLRAQIAGVTTAAQWEVKPSSTLNLAFSHKGLAALGLTQRELASFPEDFRAGMAARAEILGDTGQSAPSRFAPLDDGTAHALAIVHAVSAEALESRTVAFRLAAPDEGVVRVVYTQDTAVLVDENDGKRREHFGYVDSISQPAIRGSGAVQSQGTAVLEPGAVLLGYRQPGFDDHDVRASFPEPKALRLNGTYLVVRKLEQDVFGFRRFLKENRGAVGGDVELLAAKLVGRWRSGAPLSLAPDHDDPALGADESRNNSFSYTSADDQRGLKCPFEAHIRRANPRDSKPISDETTVAAHTLVRRSMPYGPWLSEVPSIEEQKQDRGLLFVAFNASIATQFEVQQQWLNNGNVCRGLSSVRDPLIGSNDPTEAAPGSTFTFPLDPASPRPTHTIFGIPRFVTVRGGGYFFMPGLGALSYLANLTPGPARDSDAPAAPAASQPPRAGGTFLQQFDAITAKRPVLGATAVDQELRALLRDWLLQPGPEADDLRRARYRDAWRELRDSRPVLDTPFGYFVSRFQQVQHVLSTGKAFSVREYGARMAVSSGPFFLGFDVDSPQYHTEAALAQNVIKPSDLQTIPSIVKNAAESVAGFLKLQNKVVDPNQFAIATLSRFINRYFGVPGPDDAILFGWFAAISIYIFNPVVSSEQASAAAKAGNALAGYFDRLIEARKRSGRDDDDVLDRLLRETRNPVAPINDITIRRMLVGMVSGTLIPTALMFLNAMKRLSREPGHLAVARDAAVKGDRDTVLHSLYEAARFAPEPDQIYRVCVKDCVLPGCTTKLIGNRRVIVSLGSAMMDPTAIPDPATFSIKRDLQQYSFFGFGKHECMGRYIAPIVLQEMGVALLAANK